MDGYTRTLVINAASGSNEVSRSLCAVAHAINVLHDNIGTLTFRHNTTTVNHTSLLWVMDVSNESCMAFITLANTVNKAFVPIREFL